VPLAESVEAFFEREVKPHVPDAWIDTSKRDPRTARSASSATRSTSTAMGYEINFNRYFYYAAAAAGGDRGRHPEIEKDILRMLAEVTGARPDALRSRATPVPARPLETP
jgi:type I restriction enzyme M protein